MNRFTLALQSLLTRASISTKSFLKMHKKVVLTSVLIITLIGGAIYCVNEQFNTLQQEHNTIIEEQQLQFVEQILQLEEEKEEKQEQIQQLEEEKEKLEVQLVAKKEQEKKAEVAHVAYASASRGQMPSRGGSNRDTYSAWSVTGYTAEQFDAALAGTPLAGMGYAFVKGEQASGVNGAFVMAVGALESGWFTKTANTNNYFGRKSTSGGWMSFSSKEEGILNQFRYINQPMYAGKSISGIQAIYCPDGTPWAAKVQNLMSTIYSKANAITL